MAYVDGFILAVPKKNLAAYVKMSKKAGKIWREYGALDYREWVADDVKPGKLTSFPQQREAEAERDRGVLLDHLQIARAARQDQRQGDEGSAAGNMMDGRSRCRSTASA